MTNIKLSSRRNFLKKAAVLGTAAVVSPMVSYGFESIENKGGEHITFLFQGDSITDGNRTRNMDWNHLMGHGYAYLITAKLLFEFSKKDFHFFNRGISGNTIPALAKRWEEDTIAIKPDILSILIGVNDTTNSVYGDQSFTIQNFEDGYRALLTKTRASLPNVELVIMEPFILPVGKVKSRWEDYLKEISGRQLVAKKMAEEFNAIFVPLQDAFKQVSDDPSAVYWLWDGIHPMPNGHELIARAWLKEVSKKIKFIR